MTFATKRRVLHVALVLFTLWPLLHMYLVMHFNLSAWKLAGWGMYATPRPSFSGLAVYGRRAGATKFEEVRGTPPAFQAEATRFLDSARWLGQLINPNTLARSFRQARPEFVDLRIIVYTPTLDRQSAIIVLRPVSYDYPGSGSER